jgi:hypothetical protein
VEFLYIKKNISNIPGWSTGRKIFVIESDDWGSIRMPSLDAFNRLTSAGLDLLSCDAERYNRNDSLATIHDLSALFELLTSFSDSNGKNPVITPVTIVANPDFEKIRESGFRQYHYEPFTETLKRNVLGSDIFKLWQEGIRKQIFLPQMHGREHLNVPAWLKALQMSEPQTHLAFNEGLWGFVPDKTKLPGVDFQAAFLLGDPVELDFHRNAIIEGLDLFESIFGYRAQYFVPPNGPFNNALNQTLYSCGIKFRSASKIQHEPIGYGKTKRAFHYLGQKDRTGIRYITRNCFFEPSQPGKDWVDSCLNDIKIAFRWNKPAIISSHRVNYVGSLNSSNRDSGLAGLNKLIKSILQNWPQAEFLTTPELGNLISSKNSDG